MGGHPSNYEHVRFSHVPGVLANLLDVRYVIRPEGRSRATGQTLVQRSERFALYRLAGAPGMVSLYSGWRAAHSPVAALGAVHRRGFDPRRSAIVEHLRAQPPVGGPVGSARYTSLGPGRPASPQTRPAANCC